MKVPVYEDGKPVYSGEDISTKSVEKIHYRNAPSKYREPVRRGNSPTRAPRRK